MQHLTHILMLLVTATLTGTLRSVAVPAPDHLHHTLQSDGTWLQYRLLGDEHHHCHITCDGVPIARRDEMSDFCYLRLAPDGTLYSSNVTAHNPWQRDVNEQRFVDSLATPVRDILAAQWSQATAQANARRRAAQQGRRRALGDPTTYTGEKRGLVILVNFADREMASPTAQGDFQRMFNQHGYSEHGAIGSVSDYFYDQSYGRFSLSFDVAGPYTLQHNMSHYGSNRGTTGGGDKNPADMIVEACRMADADVDFSRYDWDGDGEVEQVFVVYAGYGESNGAPASTIWPHESHLEYYDCGVQNIDRVRINTYACSCELSGNRGTTPNGIGTACHEFSHCLGLPDFYDTSYSGGFGMSYYSLMASGGHSGPDGRGEVPSGYTAYERWFAGWLQPQPLAEPCHIENMPCLADTALAYIVYNEGHPDEYFLLENRQTGRWFSYLSRYEAGHGLLATHVDHDTTAWHNNKVNSTVRHQHMTIIPADNSYGRTYSSDGKTYYSLTSQELQGDYFPGLSHTTRLTNSSHTQCGGTLFNRNTDGSYLMNKPIDNIAEENGKVSFDFDGGIYLPTPQLMPAEELTPDGFTCRWTPVAEALSYTLEIEQRTPAGPPSDYLLIEENMKKLTTWHKADGYEDLADQLDDYMQNKGWQGLKIFTSDYGAKVGTINTEGYMLAPRRDVTQRALTVHLKARAYNSGGATLQVILVPVADVTQHMQSISLTTNQQTATLCFNNIENGPYRVQLTSPQRFYLSGISIYDGAYTADDISLQTSSHSQPAPPSLQTAYNPQDSIYSRTVTDITDVCYHFSDLPTARYSYRVKAVASNIESRWSPYQEVDLSQSNGISVVAAPPSTGTWHSLTGLPVGQPRRGIYIQQGRKVIVAH